LKDIGIKASKIKKIHGEIKIRIIYEKACDYSLRKELHWSQTTYARVILCKWQMQLLSLLFRR
jgi:hypothetical protein